MRVSLHPMHEESYAVLVLAGNVVKLDVAGATDMQGTGCSGYLVSPGSYYIKDNELIHDLVRI